MSGEWQGSASAAVLVSLVLLWTPALPGSEPSAPAPSLEQALERGRARLEQAAANYPEHRQCFSCHHQTLPLLAFDSLREAGLPINRELVRAQAEFTARSFAGRLDDLRKGTGIGGRSLTVSYGLWTLDLADWTPDETTAAMVEYLLKTQREDGHFPKHSTRPPMSESLVTTTMLSAHFLRKFATSGQEAAATAAVEKARAWLAKAGLPAQEDLNFRLWGLKELGADSGELDLLRKQILSRQRADGGWGQTGEMESDAYATGQTLSLLAESGMDPQAEAYQRGVAFLLRTQFDDGSWLVETRAQPVQVFFDNGDPHGKSQFISTAATGWAVAALARALPLTEAPATPPVASD